MHKQLEKPWNRQAGRVCRISQYAQHSDWHTFARFGTRWDRIRYSTEQQPWLKVLVLRSRSEMNLSYKNKLCTMGACGSSERRPKLRLATSKVCFTKGFRSSVYIKKKTVAESVSGAKMYQKIKPFWMSECKRSLMFTVQLCTDFPFWQSKEKRITKLQN